MLFLPLHGLDDLPDLLGRLPHRAHELPQAAEVQVQVIIVLTRRQVAASRFGAESTGGPLFAVASNSAARSARRTFLTSRPTGSRSRGRGVATSGPRGGGGGGGRGGGGGCERREVGVVLGVQSLEVASELLDGGQVGVSQSSGWDLRHLRLLARSVRLAAAAFGGAALVVLVHVFGVVVIVV